MADPYFTVAEARDVPALADEDAYPNEAIEAVRDGVEEALEDAANVAFVPRTATETLSGAGWTTVIRMPHFRVLSVTSAEHDGETLDVSDVKVVKGRALYRSSGWPWGVAGLEITYEHGYDAPPFRIKRAALRLTEHFLVGSGVNDQVTRAEAGDERMWLAPREPFGIPEVDAAVRDYKHVDLSLV